MTEPTSFNATKDLITRMNEELDYGDSRSRWIRKAIELRLAIDPILDGEIDDVDERREFVIEAVEEKLDRVAAERD